MPNVLLFFVIIFIIFFNYTSFTESIESNIKYEVGKSYKIKGKWYYPKNNLDYREIGIASVNSNKKENKTKNGEIFSNKKIVAKHKTLALPTIARITNLYNGYSINVRINDRGPKNNFRIIELSKKTADYLKIDTKGLVEVKVIPDLTMKEQRKLKKINKFGNDRIIFPDTTNYLEWPKMLDARILPNDFINNYIKENDVSHTLYDRFFIRSTNETFFEQRKYFVMYKFSVNNKFL